MKSVFQLALALLLLAPAPLLRAQMPGGSSLNSVIIKLFGKHDDFTVDADFQMLDAAKKPQITLTMIISVSGGKLRADADMSTYRGPAVDAAVAGQIKDLKAIGMDRIVSITRPDKNRLIRLYPGRKAYEEVILPKEAASANAISKIKKIPLARETVDGHPCLKTKVVLMDDKNHQQEMMVWEATDQKDFPLVVQLTENGQNLVVHNRNIRMAKPLASQFEIPAGYAKPRLPNN